MNSGLEPHDSDLDEALRALARSERGHAASPRVADAVMRQWASVRRLRSPWRDAFRARRPLLAVAASTLLALTVGSQWSRTPVAPAGEGPSPVDVAPASALHSYDMLAWLDPNPDSLQIVRLSVASETLRLQGYDVSDPDGDGRVDVEMVLGTDGMARSVLVSAEAPIH